MKTAIHWVKGRFSMVYFSHPFYKKAKRPGLYLKIPTNTHDLPWQHKVYGWIALRAGKYLGYHVEELEYERVEFTDENVYKLDNNIVPVIREVLIEKGLDLNEWAIMLGPQEFRELSQTYAYIHEPLVYERHEWPGVRFQGYLIDMRVFVNPFMAGIVPIPMELLTRPGAR